jgi:signal transduction histidine kinase
MTPGRDSPSTVVDAEFVAGLLHKFSQPLTALRGSLELALELSTTPEEYRQGLQEAMEQANRMVQLYAALHELSGRHDLTAGAERAEVGSVLQAALEHSRALAESRGVIVETNFPVPLYAVVSVPRMVQSLGHLLDAFLEYSSAGSKMVISCLQSNGHAVTTFSNGDGAIPASDLPRLFDAFFASSRASAVDSSVWKALARRVVEATGGSVRAENTAPQGFRFLIRLPLAAAESDGRPVLDINAESEGRLRRDIGAESTGKASPTCAS